MSSATLSSSWNRLGILSTAILLCSGCFGELGLERAVVSGQVLWKGGPLDSGRIHFAPEPGTEAPPSSAWIKHGRYEMTNKGGVVVGTYRVEITAYKTTRIAALPGDPYGETTEVREQYLPKKYNKSSTLSFSVPSGVKRLEQDFRLEE